jgi:glutamate/tyrosine decarboxylase-like PLP-dependent enzyme
MMNSFEQRMQDQMKQTTNQQLSMADARRALTASIPAASNPEFKPIIEGIFAQALKHHNGDTNKSVEMTRKFMQTMMTSSAADLGMAVAPPGTPGFTSPRANSGDAGYEPTDWAAEVFGVLSDSGN